MKKLHQSGFVHHTLLIIIVIVVAVAWYGSYKFISSHADTSNFVVPVSSADGCWLAGRKYDATAKNNKGDCLDVCRNPNLTGNTYKRTNTDPPHGYCTKSVSLEIDSEKCINTLHRIYVKNIGCARRTDQDNTNKAKQCQPDYPNYVADTATDRCIANKIANPPSTPTPPSTPSTPSAPNPNLSLDAITCDLMGRTFTNNNTATICNEVCQPDAGPLVVGTVTIANTTTKRKYCVRSIGSVNGDQNHCITKLHRVWTGDGCARRADQKDTGKDTVHCQAGYPYYNANFDPKNQPGTLIDVCERDKATALANEANNTIGAEPTTPGNPGDQPGGGDGGDQPGDGGGDQPGGGDGGGQPEPGSVDFTISKAECALLGRQWEPARTNAAGDKTQGGCRTNVCLSGVKITSSTGKMYCTNYAEKISIEKCANLHRVWLPSVAMCAQNPKQDRTRPLTNAPQCLGKFTTYVFHTNNQGSDECLTPTATQRIASIAKSAGKPFAYVASLGKHGICNLRGDRVWEDGKCVKVSVSTVKVASFNVLGASHTDGPNANKPGKASYKARWPFAIRAIEDANFDVVGLQEFQAPQRALFMRGDADKYGIFPRTAEYGNSEASVNSIIWNKSTFSYVDGGLLDFVYFNGHVNKYPWVKLKNVKSDQIIVFMNTHDPADTQGNAASARYRDARLHLQDISRFTGQGLPVIMTGDFNATAEIRERNDRPFTGNDRSKLAYCVFSTSGVIWNAYDSLHNRTGGCPSQQKDIAIDQVWINRGSKATDYGRISDKNVNVATDHQSIVWASVKVDRN